MWQGTLDRPSSNGQAKSLIFSNQHKDTIMATIDTKHLYWAGPAAAVVLAGGVYLASQSGSSPTPGGPDASTSAAPAHVSRSTVPLVNGKPAEVVYEIIS